MLASATRVSSASANASASPPYRGTSLIRKCLPVGLYIVVRGGGGRFPMSEVSLYPEPVRRNPERELCTTEHRQLLWGYNPVKDDRSDFAQSRPL